jgi:hypothetical protein
MITPGLLRFAPSSNQAMSLPSRDQFQYNGSWPLCRDGGNFGIAAGLNRHQHNFDGNSTWRFFIDGCRYWTKLPAVGFARSICPTRPGRYSLQAKVRGC